MSELTVGQLKGLSVNNNVITVPSGHELYASGHIIQVQTLDNVTRSTQGVPSDAWADITGMSLSITPKKTTSKILITARWFGEFSSQGMTWDSVFGIKRDSIQIGGHPDPFATARNGITSAAISYVDQDANSTAETMSLFTTDYPNTTSLTTYKLTYNGASGTIYNNRTIGWNTGTTTYELGTSSMVLMEIAQ